MTRAFQLCLPDLEDILPQEPVLPPRQLLPVGLTATGGSVTNPTTGVSAIGTGPGIATARVSTVLAVPSTDATGSLASSCTSVST